MSTKNSTKVEKIDIRKLFFDRSKKTYIEFDLEKLKTCEEIYNTLKKEIEEKILEIYDENIRKKSNFNFIMIYPRSNKYDISSFMEIKIDRTQQLSNIMTNSQLSLCYLPQNYINIEYKRKTRDRIKEEEHNANDRFKDVERETISNHTIEKYLNNEGVYYFDKEKVEFLYGKGFVDENKIIINYKKSSVTILVDEIKKEIEEKISESYDENIRKKSNFNFIMIYPRSNKFDISSFMEIKIDRTQQLSNIMTNLQYSLCYLPQNYINIEYKRKKRDRIEEEEHNANDRFKDVERETISNHTIEKYLNNEGVYYFDKEKVEFLYGKGFVDENKIIINYKKTSVTILVDEIKKEECYENKVPPSIQDFKIKCPNFIFQIHQNNNIHF
jgi:hypothetical protein